MSTANEELEKELSELTVEYDIYHDGLPVEEPIGLNSEQTRALKQFIIQREEKIRLEYEKQRQDETWEGMREDN